MTDWLITTDLDGTLLNHHSYDATGIPEIIEQLQHHAIPVILNSSKTLAELTAWRHQLNLLSPVIAENGGVMANHHTECLGVALTDFLPSLHAWREQLSEPSFVGFSDWSLDEVVAATGLSSAEAALAKARLVSEPIKWLGTEALLVQFETYLAQLGLQCVAGGRFFHVMGRHSKATALAALRSDVSSWLPDYQFKPDYQILALGDGDNDRAMLMAADVAVIMPKPDGSYLKLATRPGQQVIYSALPAPAGWIQCVEQLIFQEAG
ncbi:mannosyl-3-phosphoglycerate phosphatase [Thiomicrospira aerophila AL3]|uniref:Mannosyl-3-phosphoglycerate phosphatase n=1 Tax=Thiomicrospira aerophila AL3 TaxID=717772 RepID=W0DYI1_9GAMM|nr:HAD-IIB family hydrolase [Thiomicrospira aerophila]AHF02049.1 mannosyl-3-phosphoglycerate phosphatase [Thiomicrospira aerophila AL3]